MLDKIALNLFVSIMGVVAMPKVEIAPLSPVEIEVYSRQQFTCTITVQTNWRSVFFYDSSDPRKSPVATFYNNGNCTFFSLSNDDKLKYEISCGTTLGKFHFIIKSVTTKHHNQTVECVAQYGSGSSSDLFVRDSSVIIVIIPLKSIIISPETSPIAIQEDEIKRFTCNATSRPLTNIIWKIQRNGQSIEDMAPHEEQVNGATIKSILNYIGVETDDKAVIFCIGQYNGSDIESTIIRLEIIYAPNKNLSIHQVPAANIITGDNVTLTCKVSGGNPLPQLAWNCSGITRNNSAGNEASYSVVFTVDKSFNNIICTCYVSVHPIMLYRPTKHQLIVVFYPPDKTPTIQSNPASNILAGQNITLLCTVSGGNPLPTLSWNCTGTNHNGTSGPNASRSITFIVKAADNNKICTCLATQLITSYQRHVDHILVVYYAPNESLSIEMVPERDITAGDNVTLICTVLGGNPLATLLWNCTGHKTNHNSGSKAESRVVLTVDKTYNNMICTCLASHPVTTYKPTIQYKLVVHFGPSMANVTSTPEMPWFEGNSTYLICNFEEGNPKASIQWKRGNKSEESNNDNPKFAFDQLKREDNGLQIACSVFNNYSGMLSQFIYLNVQYVPKIMLETTYILTNESKSISLSCNASGNPMPTVKWKMDRRELNSLTGDKSILEIVNINRTDSGNYTCEAISSSTKYGNLISKKDTEVVVNFAPDITVTKSVLNITEHTSLTLTCNAAGKPSQFVYGWRHMFAGIVIRVFNTNTKTLPLSNLSYQDIGQYECFANNGIEDKHGKLNQTNSTDVEVTFKPAFVLYDKVITGKAGTNVSVSVDVISFPDIDNAVKWRNLTENSILVNSSNIFMTLERKCIYTKIYNISVPFDKHGYTSSLHFPNFDENLDGFYNLEVSNIIGVNNKTVRVVFSDQPDPPTSFSAIIVGSTVVTLTWREGFNGGNNQTFIITYWEMNSIFKKSVNVSERSDKKYEVEISDLIPSTSYVFHIIAKNEEGYSDSANNTIEIPTKDISETESSVIGPVAGAVGGIFAAGLFVVGIIVFRRKRLASGKKTDRKNLTFASPDEDNEDGLKDNELYVSAGENFTENSVATGDVYAEIRKPTYKKSKDKYIQETVLYAEVIKKKDEAKTGEVSKTARTNQKGKQITKGKLKKENGRNDDVYENITDKNTQDTSKNRNKDGLVYADLVFKEDGKRNFIIRGIENKTDYADIDLDLKADPLPSDESEEEKEKVTENGDLNG